MTERKGSNFSISAGIGFIAVSGAVIPTGVVIGGVYP